MKDHCDFPAFTAHRIADNMMHIDFKKIKQMTTRDIKQLYECLEECGGKDGVYVMVTFRGYIPMSKEAMTQAKKEEHQKYIRASAIVVKSAAFRLGIKFFMNFYKPNRPMNIFGTKEKAIAWLKKTRKQKK